MSPKETRLIPGPPGPSPVLRVGGGRVRFDLVWQVVCVLYDTHTAHQGDLRKPQGPGMEHKVKKGIRHLLYTECC